MLRLNSFLSGKLGTVLGTLIVLTMGTLAPATVAWADTPEYWTRETFNTEKSTMTTSLQSVDEEGSSRPRRRARAAQPTRSDNPKIEQAEKPKKQARVRTASLGRTYVPEEKAQKSVSGGGGIRWIASASCLDGGLRGVLSQVASRFGSVTVNSTCRSPGHNRRVGGASKSWHLTGDAADFRIHGNWGAASSFLRGSVGGFKHYGGGLFHIDTGPKRTW